MSNLYKIVGDIVRKTAKKQYKYGAYVCRLEISYDGIEWERIDTYADLDYDFNVIFDWDFWEGQEYWRNIMVCPIDEVIFPQEVESRKDAAEE